MGRQNVYKTFNGSLLMPPPMVENMIDFLSQNRSFLLSTERKAEAFKSKSYNHNIISEIVHRLSVARADQSFALINIPARTVALREAVDMTFVPIDLLQAKELSPNTARMLSVLPELNDKLVINVTDLTKANGDFVDTSRFFGRVVRDFLSRNYYTSTGSVWISTALVRYVAKVYSMTIGGQLWRSFRLSDNIQTFVQTVFCAYYVGRMTSPDLAIGFLKANAKGLNIPQGNDLLQITELMQEKLGYPTPLTLEDVFTVINSLEHDQLKTSTGSRLNRAILNARFASMAPEQATATLALEYPPYLLFMILQVLSGERIGIGFPLKNLHLDKEGKEVADQLLKTPSLYQM